MKASRTPLSILALSNAALIVALAWTSDRLPERVASHFDASGIADAWSSRVDYLWTTAALGCGLSLAIAFLFYFVRFVPDSGINLPRREYWLAPEHRAKTYSILFNSGIWLACLMSLFVLTMHFLVIEANAAQPPRMSDNIWLLIGGLTVAIGIWTYLLVHRFTAGR